MGKLRSVNTQFWSDPWVEELSPTEKLLYLYFITNEKTNMLGVYELSIRKISFETGIDKKTIENALESFERIGKVKYTKNYIILLNFAKHQNYNTNMKKSAIDVFNELPKELNINGKTIDKGNPLEGFEMVCNRLGMVRKIEVEVEDETESESEYEEESEVEDSEILFSEIWPTFDDFWDEYDKKVGNKEKIEKKWSKLSQSVKEEIMAYLPNYKISQPEKKFRKNPETFLNNNGWEDELIISNEKVKKQIDQFKRVEQNSQGWDNN